MRPQRFQDWAVEALRQGPEVAEVEPWQEGHKQPFGVKTRLRTGAEIWMGITAVSPPGEDYGQPEQPVEGEAPAAVPVPELVGATGKVAITQAERHLAALLNNAGSGEVAGAYGYSDRGPAQNPGVGVDFHSGGKIHCVFVHALRSGQNPGSPYNLPTEV
ncbi:hypothetical protein [Streptomyces rapamycinicus]|uniref:Uncharacterized protein n=2 Tax=Streptomyces rapamycinicus TaxID=1226757 RepID=A0A0A0N9T3_STRRN|nr:hypothetical protein [Streptomyces rapamycinicus]AGP56202.1 hypothetical protein M271_23460 [Streptomyces rapamycinicus NRRL 5491]MBB4783811.1 hypothetical protein [Streptomyces rapamycinicus]RLV80717.1 hypothetical protein D3C57_120070 [Streptomyces rapamycinicus NRRL 5491]UTO64168.1 hypothetical protein LJB45_18750 [Streptomyces rapamycinicus]UTP32123.1 hypothetical protein LIV37_23870 [Streptomyces rapamycinicus NRRL 5491]